jgi:hypothetical protein
LSPAVLKFWNFHVSPQRTDDRVELVPENQLYPKVQTTRAMDETRNNQQAPASDDASIDSVAAALAFLDGSNDVATNRGIEHNDDDSEDEEEAQKAAAPAPEASYQQDKNNSTSTTTITLYQEYQNQQEQPQGIVVVVVVVGSH